MIGSKSKNDLLLRRVYNFPFLLEEEPRRSKIMTRWKWGRLRDNRKKVMRRGVVKKETDADKPKKCC